MTNHESITVSLDVAKELKEAGWPQEDYFVWVESATEDEDPELCTPMEWNIFTKGLFDACKSAWIAKNDCAAPTAEEILRRLPNAIYHKGSIYYLVIRDKDCVSYERAENMVDNSPLHDSSENGLRNSLAAMYCYLAEHNLLPS